MAPAATPETLLSVSEAARIAGVSRQHIWRQVRRGVVPAIRVGPSGIAGPIRIPREAFLEWLYGEEER